MTSATSVPTTENCAVSGGECSERTLLQPLETAVTEPGGSVETLYGRNEGSRLRNHRDAVPVGRDQKGIGGRGKEAGMIAGVKEP